MKQYIAFAGSRSVKNAAQIQAVVQHVAGGALQFFIGDAKGADEIVIDALYDLNATRLVTIFSVGDQRGDGTWRDTANPTVGQAQADGAHIVYQDDATKPLTKRLSSRTAKMVYAANRAGGRNAALVCFFEHANSRGTEWAAKCAVQADMLIVAYGDPAHLPNLGAGHWEPAIAAQFKGAQLWITARMQAWRETQQHQVQERRQQYGRQLSFAI